MATASRLYARLFLNIKKTQLCRLAIERHHGARHGITLIPSMGEILAEKLRIFRGQSQFRTTSLLGLKQASVQMFVEELFPDALAYYKGLVRLPRYHPVDTQTADPLARQAARAERRGRGEGGTVLQTWYSSTSWPGVCSGCPVRRYAQRRVSQSLLHPCFQDLMPTKAAWAP